MVAAGNCVDLSSLIGRYTALPSGTSCLIVVAYIR